MKEGSCPKRDPSASFFGFFPLASFLWLLSSGFFPLASFLVKETALHQCGGGLERFSAAEAAQGLVRDHGETDRLRFSPGPVLTTTSRDKQR
jgi:hypothetical protein